MITAQDIPWEFIIFVLIFAVVLFYFTFFQGYLTAAIYRSIIRCILPKNLSVHFTYFQFSVLSGHILIRDLMFANLSMKVEISRLSVALKYWSKIPDFNENDKDDGLQNEKNMNNVEWIRSSHESKKKQFSPEDVIVKKKKGIFKTIFDRKSRFVVNIDGLHITLFNQSEDAISRIETFRKIFGLDKKTTEEATQIYNDMYPSLLPQPYQLSIIMRVILPMTFKINSMLVSIGNPELPSVLFLSAKKVKGLFTMMKREDPQHSLKQRLTFYMSRAKLRSVPNHDYSKHKLVPDSMRILKERFEKKRTIFYTDVLNVMYTQDAFGCYVRSEDKNSAMLATAEPKNNIQIGLMNAKIEYGSYTDKLRSAFMRYFKPFLFINPTVYPNSFGRIKYMDISVAFFGDQPAEISLPFATSQGLSESLIVKFDGKPESMITMSIPQYVASVDENKMEVICNFLNTRISTSLGAAVSANLGSDEGSIIKSSSLLVYYITFSPEKWFEESITKVMISFERCKTKLAPYHIDFLTDLGTDFVSTYPFESPVDDMDLFQPSNYYVSFKMVDAKIQLLSKTNPKFENICRISNHQRMVIRTPMLGAVLQMPSKVFLEREKGVTFSLQLSNPILKFLLPGRNINQFRRNCYKWAHEEADKSTDNEPMSNQIFETKKNKFNSDKGTDNDNDDDDNNDNDDNDHDDDDSENEEEEEFLYTSRENDNNNDNNNDNDNHEDIEGVQSHEKYVKHEYLSCSSITLSGSYKWNKEDGNRQFPLLIKIGKTDGLISAVCIKSLLAVISNYSSSNKRHPDTSIHNSAFDSYVKPEPEFPDSKMHMQVNVQIVKADIGVPFDLYDTSAFVSLHAANFYLSVESYQPFFHVIFSLPSVSVTFNKTNYPSERFYYERIGDSVDMVNPREVIHVNGIQFAIKNTQVTKPQIATLFSLLNLEVGEVSGTISVYQLFSLIDLALNFMHLWFSFDVIQLLDPDFDSIYLPRQIQVSIRTISIIIDFIQYGLMYVYLPTGIIVYQDNIINEDSHKAMFINIPTIDVRHIYQPDTGGTEMSKKKKRKKKKRVPFQSAEKSSSSHNKVVFLIDSTSTTNTSENFKVNDYEEEEEEEEEEEKKEKVTFLSQLRSVFHFSTYVSIIRRGRYENAKYDSNLQMKYLNDYDPEHHFIDLMSLPRNIKLPRIFYNYNVTLDEEYTLIQTFRQDPNNENNYELPIHEIHFSNQDQYASSDISQLWLHLFQIQRFARFGKFHENDVFDMDDPGLSRFDIRRNGMHVIISPKTTLLMNIEYTIVLMLMMKTFNLHSDSHFLSAIARDVVTDLWMQKVVKFKTTSLNLPGLLISIIDFNREIKCNLSVQSIDLIMANEVDVSNQMTLSVSDISLDIYSKIDPAAAASLKLPLIELGKIDGDTSIRVNKLNFNTPLSSSLLRIINYSLSYILPVLSDVESPGIGVGLNDFKQALSKYIDEDENLCDYYAPYTQNDAALENIEYNNNDDDDSHHHKSHKKKKAEPSKIHKSNKKKNKHKKSRNSSQKEDESLSNFDDNDSVFEDEKNDQISRYFLAYAKLCNARKSIMNFVDTYQFDDIDEHEEEMNENKNDNENVRKVYFSESNIPTFASDNKYINPEKKKINRSMSFNEGKSESSIHVKKINRTLSFNEGAANSPSLQTLEKIKIEAEKKKKQKKLEKSRTIIKIGKIQFNLMNSIINVKLDPISLISKENNAAARVVIKSIKCDLKSDLISFLWGIRKPKKEAEEPASSKFTQKKVKKKTDKKFVIHFILQSFILKVEYLILSVKTVTALVNISSKPFVTLSLMDMLVRVDEYAQLIFGGFDLYYSKDIDKGSFCLKPVEIKFAMDLVLNPKECVNINIFTPQRKRKTSENIRKNHEKMNKNLDAFRKNKTEKLIKKVKKFNQNEKVHNIINLLNNISFFFIVNETKIEATIDDVSTAALTFPGMRGGVFDDKILQMFFYLIKPEVSVTNILSKPLIDVYMFGYLKDQTELNLFITSGNFRIKTTKETLSKIASLVNGLLSKVPKKQQEEETPTKSRQVGRKSVANLNFSTKHNSSSNLEPIRPLKLKKISNLNLDEFSSTAIKVVNTIYDGLEIFVQFTIPSIIIDIPEISSNLYLYGPVFSVKCTQIMCFGASIKKLNLQVDKSDVSIEIKFSKDDEQKSFIMDNLSIIVTPSLFKHLNRIKEFFVGIKSELTHQENIHNIFKDINNRVQISVKKNVIKIFDPNSFLKNSGRKMKSNQPEYEIPTITSDKFKIDLNNSVINLKLSDKEAKRRQPFQSEEENNSKNKGDNFNKSGFFLEIPSVSLSLETRKSEHHNKTATAANFILKSLNIEDKNERLKFDKYSNQNFSSVHCEEANISALSFVNHLNVDVVIKSFHISLYPTVPFVFAHLFSFLNMIKKDIMTIKTAKIMETRQNISEKKKLKMLARRGSLKDYTTESSYVIFDLKIENTAVIFHSPRTSISLPSVHVYGNFEKTNSTFSPQKLHTTVHILPVQTSISPDILKWLKKLLENFQNTNVVALMKRRMSITESAGVINDSDGSFEVLNIAKKPKKVLALKFMLNVTVFLDQINFNLGCQPSNVVLQFGLRNLIVHFTTKTDCASFQIGDIIISTEKMNEHRKSSIVEKRTSPYRPKFLSHSAVNDLRDDNGNRLLSIEVMPIDGMLGREVQIFNINTVALSVSNNEMEDLFTFLKVWVEPIMEIIKNVSVIYFNKIRQSSSMNIQPPKLKNDNGNNNGNNRNNVRMQRTSSNFPSLNVSPTKDETKQKSKSKGQLNMKARIQMLSISFIYSGSNGKLRLELKPVLFSKSDLTTNFAIPEILLFANGFIEGTVQIKPVILILNNVKKKKEKSEAQAQSPQSQLQLNPKHILRRNSITHYKRLNSVVVIKSINCDIKSYGDPLLFFKLRSIYLFYLLLPPSDQILSLTVDSPQLKMTAQAISKFKGIVASIMDPIKKGIARTKIATVQTENPRIALNDGRRPNVSTFALSSSSTADQDNLAATENKKVKKKVQIEKASIDLLLEKLQIELYKYYMTDKEAVKLTADRASLSVNVQEKSKENPNQLITIPKITRNMNFVFEPMELLRLFCRNGIVIDQRSVLSIPEILGSLNTNQEDQDVTYDFITDFKDSVEASLTITDYEAVRDIIMFAIKSLTSNNFAEDEISPLTYGRDEDDDEIYDKPVDNNKKLKEKKEFNFTINNYDFSPQFKISLGAKIQPNVKWILERFGISDEHVIPSTLFKYVSVSLQGLLEYIAQAIASE